MIWLGSAKLITRWETPGKGPPLGPEALAFARYGVGKALRAAGRADEAVAMLELCVALEDADYHEELAEDYTAVGRHADAREQAERALALIPEAGDASRIARLRELAAVTTGT